MKRIIIPLSCFIILISGCSFAAEKAVVNVTAVRIRESASTDSNIIVNVYEDDEVEILEQTGDWYKVQYGTKVGYAKAEFFTKKSSTETTSNTPTNTTSTPQEPAVPAVNNTTDANPPADTETPQQTPSTDAPSELQENSEELTVGDNILIQAQVKLRNMPSFSAVEKSEVPAQTNLIIQSKLGKWVKVTDGSNISGWITSAKAKIISNTGNTPDPTPVNNPPEVPATPNDQVEAPKPEEPKNAETPKDPETQKNSDDDNTSEYQNKTAIVIVETARVRKSASTNGELIGTLDEDDIVTIVGEEGNFYKITTSSINGYVSKSLVRIKNVSSRSSATERTIDDTISQEENNEISETLSEETSNAITGEDVVNFAKQYLGYPYVLGASSPEKGFDCSGFTRYIFGHFGYKLGHVAASQTELGSIVERSNLQTGDLLLFYNDAKTKIGHCGIYINSGEFIHSANPQRGVVTDNLNTSSYYSQRFVTARRIVE